MNITPDTLLDPQAYALVRPAYRARMIDVRRTRTVALGPAMRLQFEDAGCVAYQVQEVVRAERITDRGEVQREIDRYAQLLPDGTSWRATLMIELPDARRRARELPALSDAAHHVYVERPGRQLVLASVNADLPDRHRGRPSAVHFLNFALPPSFRTALAAGDEVTLGCAHPAYAHRLTIPAALLERLVGEVVCPEAAPERLAA